MILHIRRRRMLAKLDFLNFFENFERPFTPRGWLRSAWNFGETRFRRFCKNDLPSLKFLFWGQVFETIQNFPKISQNIILDFCFRLWKSKLQNRLKRLFPKFHADRSHPRGLNGLFKISIFLKTWTPRKIFGSENQFCKIVWNAFPQSLRPIGAILRG